MTNYISRREISLINEKIRKDNLALYDAKHNYLGSDRIHCTRIDISQNHQAYTSEHNQIDENTMYLVLIYDDWYLGNFSKQWYGWTFNNWGNTSCELKNIQVVFAVNLKNPIVAQAPYLAYGDKEDD